MSKSFQGHKPKSARLGKAGLATSQAAPALTEQAKAPEASAKKPSAPHTAAPHTAAPQPATPQPAAPKAKEIGGPSGPEPTRYGDWERKGICYDF